MLGGNESRGGLFAAVKDENTFVFVSAYNAIAEQIKDHIEKHVANLRAGIGAAQPFNVAPDDIPTQIKKLAELRDNGILSAAGLGTTRALEGLLDALRGILRGRGLGLPRTFGEDSSCHFCL